MLIPLGVYLLLLAGSVVASSDPRASLRGLSRSSSSRRSAGPPAGARRAAGAVAGRRLIALAALLACDGLSQYLLGYGDIDRRIRGPFSHYMTFSGFLLICDLLLLASMIYAGRWRSPWRWAALAAINAALLGSYTRNAWVALALSLTVLILLRVPKLLLAYLPAAVLFVVLAPVPLLHRVLSIVDLRDASNYDRLCMLEAGLDDDPGAPALRRRSGSGEAALPDLPRPSAPRYEVPHLHNSCCSSRPSRGSPAWPPISR